MSDPLKIGERLVGIDILDDLVARFGRVEAVLNLIAKALQDDADATDAVKGARDLLTSVIEDLDKLTTGSGAAA